jgi:hypothetical protein
LTPVPSQIEFIDTFPIRDEDGLVPGFYVSVSFDPTVQGSWRGWQLWADYGDGYVQIASGDVSAIQGVTTSTLASVSDPAVFDTTNTVTIQPTYGVLPATFTTVSQSDLDANPRRNLFLIGDEYIQAATITDNADGTYDLDDIYHARFQTTCSSHAVGERVVYMNGSEAFVPIDASRLNEPFDYKAVSVNQNVADATAVSFVWTGANMRPREVQNITIYRDTDKNVQSSFPPTASLSDQDLRYYWQDIMGGLNTFTVDSTTDIFTKTGHGLVAGQEIAVSNSGGALPRPLEKRKHYYVRDVTTDTFKLARGAGGSAINITTNGTGTNSYAEVLRHIPYAPGALQPAILEEGTATETPGSGGWLKTFTSTHTNDIPNSGMVVVGPATDTTPEIRQIFGAITETGAIVEFTWGQSGKNPVMTSAHETHVSFDNSVGATKHKLQFKVIDNFTDYGGSGSPAKITLDYEEDGAPATLHDTSGEMPNASRYRMEIVGSEVHVYRNHAGPGSPRIFQGTVAPVYPLELEVQVARKMIISNITIGGLPVILFTYLVGEQDLDFGTAPSTVRFRIYEERVFQNVSFLGDVTDFTT